MSLKCLIVNHNARLKKELFDFFSDYNPKLIEHYDFDPDYAETFDFVVLSGGPISITHEDEVPVEKEWLQKTNKPVFAVCLGHQIVGVAGGVPLLTFKKKKEGPFDADILGHKGILMYYNNNYIKEAPFGFKVLARDEYMIEAMEHKEKPIFTIQGHPEVSGELGRKIRDTFINKHVLNKN
ncbi:hypothetical protein ACFLTH_08050 [Bacteroidota bacterium]